MDPENPLALRCVTHGQRARGSTDVVNKVSAAVCQVLHDGALGQTEQRVQSLPFTPVSTALGKRNEMKGWVKCGAPRPIA